MHTVKLNIQDDVYNHVMFLLRSLRSKGIDIIDDSTSTDSLPAVNYETWTQEEIKNIGKIGLHSKSFEEDNEDYSKW